MKSIKILWLSLPIMLTMMTCKDAVFYALDDTELLVSADKTAIKANGDKALITLIGITADGEAVHDHTLITFTATLGMIPATAETFAGRAQVEFVSGSQNGTARITARSGRNVSDALEIAIGSGALANMTIIAIPAILEPGGGRSLISVYTFDGSMNALAGIPVILSTTGGTLDRGNAVRLSDKNGLVSESLYTQETATVTALAGNINKTAMVTVKKNALPDSVITISPASAKINETVYFDGSLSSDSDGRIEKWEWNFGDGNDGLGEKTTHAYLKAGTYSVTLKVTDNDDGSKVSMKSVTVSE
jgi:hypothetical protein